VGANGGRSFTGGIRLRGGHSYLPADTPQKGVRRKTKKRTGKEETASKATVIKWGALLH